MTAYYIMRPVRDQLSGAVGSQSLPLFYGSVFVVMLLLTPVFGALVAHFPRKRLLGWSFSADIFDSVQARRVFPLIALGGMAGAIVGPLITKFLVQLIGVAHLLEV